MPEGDSSGGDEVPIVLGGWPSLAGESGYASGEESDDSGDSSLLDDPTAASTALQVRRDEI